MIKVPWNKILGVAIAMAGIVPSVVYIYLSYSALRQGCIPPTFNFWIIGSVFVFSQLAGNFFVFCSERSYFRLCHRI